MSTLHIRPTSDQHFPCTAPSRLPAAIGLVLILCLPAIFIIRLSHVTNPHLSRPGDPVPSLTARDLDSDTIHQLSFAGTPAALLFFSADCRHCQRELGSFDRLNRRFGDRILFLAISMSNKVKTTELANSLRPGMRILLDEQGASAERFGVEVVPALFLVGPDETIAYGDTGEKSFGAREQLLSEFINSIQSTRR